MASHVLEGPILVCSAFDMNGKKMLSTLTLMQPSTVPVSVQVPKLSHMKPENHSETLFCSLI